MREMAVVDSDKAIEYITRRGWRESRLGLERIEELLTLLGNPHEKLKYIHVAGTNGKGSTCAMLAAIFAEAGYKTGLYTSPYINCFNERIQINGQSISDDDLAKITARVQCVADQMADHPTEFELVTAVAFQYYFEQGCDIVVLEVGLGGRLDATNIIPVPEIAVITPISLDHVAELGDTIEKIAAEKGGIIKSGGTVVSSPQESNVFSVLQQLCDDNNARFELVMGHTATVTQNGVEGQCFDFRSYSNLTIQLLGGYQIQNAVVAVSVAERLFRAGWNISETDLRKGLEKAKWPARFEIIHREPWVIVDGGHNPQCVECLVDNLNTYFPGKRITFITGVMADKDYKAMFSKVIPMAERVFTVTPDNPRALDAGELAVYFYEQGVQDVKPCASVEQSVEEALEATKGEDVVCVFGSFYMAGIIRKYFGKH